MYATYPSKSEKSVRNPGNEVINGCELPWGCLERNIGHLEEWQVVFTD